MLKPTHVAERLPGAKFATRSRFKRRCRWPLGAREGPSPFVARGLRRRGGGGTLSPPPPPPGRVAIMGR